jgi:hypothetical protein
LVAVNSLWPLVTRYGQVLGDRVTIYEDGCQCCTWWTSRNMNLLEVGPAIELTLVTYTQ